MTLWWAVALIGLGVVLDRWLPRAMHQADRERAAQQLRPFGAAPSNCRVVHRPFDWEVDGDG